MTVGERIKLRRTELGLTQEDLAKRLGYSTKSAICRIEKDYEQNLTSDRLSRIANALSCTPAYLMGWKDDVELSSPELDAEITNDKEFKQLWKQYLTLTEEQKASVRVLIGTYYRANK